MTAQFKTLTWHFFNRFFDVEMASPDADPRKRTIQLLALLAMPGLFLPIFFHVRHPYVYVAYSMVVMGVVSTFKWSSLFPDRRDYLVLTALPVSPGRVFAAKTWALAAFLALFAAASNLFSMWIVPFMNVGGTTSWFRLVQAFLAHAAGVFGGAVFVALFFLALQGALINFLGTGTFTEIAARVQMLSITLLLAILLATPLIRAGIEPLAAANSAPLDYFPLVWFFGLYEHLLPGADALPASGAWATTGIFGLLTVAALTGVSYWAGYRRHSRKVVESIDSRADGSRRHRKIMEAFLNRILLRNPIERASFYFIGNVSARSGTHQTLTALYYGVGIALAVSSLFVVDRRFPEFPFRISTDGALEAPLILSFLFVSGLRASFNVPHELGANWLFQVASGGSGEYLRATRKWLFLSRILPLYAILAPLEFLYFGPAAVLHVTFDLAATALLIEAFFLNFRKVPYTCAHFPGKVQMSLLAAGYLYAFTTVVGLLASVKGYAVAETRSMMITLAVAAAALIGFSTCRRYRRRRGVDIVFAETDPTYTSLDLS